MDPDALIVVSAAQWIFQDFFSAAGDFPVHHSLGLGLPNLRGSEYPAIWASTAHAARLQHAGMSLPLLAPGPQWLAELPGALRGREVFNRTLESVLGDLSLMENESLHWIKLAEMKDDRLPAQRGFIRDFALKALSLGAPGGTRLHITPTNLPIEREDRFFIVDNQVVTGSPYIIKGQIFDWDKHWGLKDWQVDPVAKQFAQEVAWLMNRFSPRAYTLDIAMTDSRPIVLEVNPMWSSGYYGADLAAVIEGLKQSIDYTGTKAYLWRPDPWLIAKACFKRPLQPE